MNKELGKLRQKNLALMFENKRLKKAIKILTGIENIYSKEFADILDSQRKRGVR